MEGTIVWQYIQKLNKKMWRHNLIGVALIIGLGCSQYRYLYNCLLGVQKIDTEQIIKLKDTDRIDREFVTFTSKRIVDTGITKVLINKRKNTSTLTLDSKYAVAMLDRGRVILIELQPQADLQQLTLTGKLSKIPVDTRNEVVDRLLERQPILKERILPVMLESGDYKASLEPLLFMLASGLALCSWNLYRAKVRTNNPRKHPIYRSLLAYGDGDVLAGNLDREIRDEYFVRELAANTLFLTPSWFLLTRRYNLQIAKLERLVWIFKKVTHHSVNSIPADKTYAIVLCDSLGKEQTFPIAERDVDRIINQLHTHAPWAVVGFSPETKKMWDRQRQSFYAMVERRKNKNHHSRAATSQTPSRSGDRVKAQAAAPQPETKDRAKVKSPSQETKVNEQAPPVDRVNIDDLHNSSDVRPDLDLDLNLGFYEAIFGCAPEIRVHRLEIQPNGEFAPTLKQIKVVVPAGAANGTRLRIAGQGNLCTVGGKPGDVYLRLKVPFQADGLTREGDDIFTEVKLTPAQAQAGIEVRVRTLDGNINLQIPPGSKHRSFITLPGRGVLKRGSALDRGDLVVWIEIEPSAKSAQPKVSTDFDNIKPNGSSVAPTASANFDNIKSSLDGLAQLGWIQEESAWSADFTLDPRELSNVSQLDRAVRVLLDRARRVAPGFSVPTMVPRVIVESMPAAAGQFEVDEEGWVTIRVSPDFERDLPAARAILAHEVCHYILENRGIRQPNFQLNERDTDLCMFICGFGDVFLAGYKRQSACNEYRPGHRLGYLTDAEYEFANRYASELRSTYRQNLKSELDVLKEQLLRKAHGDRDRVRRLIEYERQRDRSLSELDLYRNAIDRLDRD